MVVYVVQYHSNAWGDQMACDDILGVFTSEEKAEKRREEFEKEYAWSDDNVIVMEFNLDEEVPSYLTNEGWTDEE